MHSFSNLVGATHYTCNLAMGMYQVQYNAMPRYAYASHNLVAESKSAINVLVLYMGSFTLRTCDIINVVTCLFY